MNFFYFLIFFQINAWAQNNTPFDFLEANRSLRAAGKFTGFVPSQNSPKVEECHPVQSDEGETVMSCAIEEKDYNDSVILKNEYTAGKIPPQIEASLPAAFRLEAKKKNVSCVFRFKSTNDNINLLGCKDKDRIQRAKKCGDDFGYTHGLSTAISCATEDGISTTFSYSTDLYSSPDLDSMKMDADGTNHLKQKFTSENIFGILQDSINQNKVTYWKRGIGFINLSEKNKWGLMQSTGQQEWFHHVINKISPSEAYDYTYVEGSKDKWGPFVTLSIGLQENRRIGDKCKLSLSADVGGRLSTIKESNTLNLNLNGKFSYELSQNGSIYLRGQSETVVRPSSTVTQQSLAVGYERKSGTFFEAGVTKQKGNRTDVADTPNAYVNKNDLLVYMRVGYGFN